MIFLEYNQRQIDNIQVLGTANLDETKQDQVKDDYAKYKIIISSTIAIKRDPFSRVIDFF